MKRFIVIVAVVLGVAYTVSADERPIDLASMPKEAQSFISKNFADYSVVMATVDNDIMDTDYEVRLNDGTKIDFNSRGEWTDISNKRTGIPEKIIPNKLTEYVKKHYDQTNIISIERDNRHYEIKLSNGVELVFSTDGRLLGFDD